MANQRFSRENHYDPELRYVGVRLQQGVPLLDTDWNEQEDMLRDQVRTLIRHLLGDGVTSTQAFRIKAASPEAADFVIGGQGGNADDAARAYVKGLGVFLGADLAFSAQMATLDPREEGADEAMVPVETPTLPDPPAAGIADHMTYLDVWERNAYPEKPPPEGTTPTWEHMVLDGLGIESCTRLRREFVVRVADGASLPDAPSGHLFLPLAMLRREAGRTTVQSSDITDLRRTGLNLAGLLDEIKDARGTRERLGNRLDISLQANGELRGNTVGTFQLKERAVARTKVALRAVGQDELDQGAVRSEHIGSAQVGGSHLANESVADKHVVASSLTHRVLASDSVRAAQVKDGEISAEHIKNQAVQPQHFQPGCVGNDAVAKYGLATDRLEIAEEHSGRFRMWWPSDKRGTDVGCWVPFHLPFAYPPLIKTNYSGKSQNIEDVAIVTVGKDGFLLRVGLGTRGNNGRELRMVEELSTYLQVLEMQFHSPYLAVDVETTSTELQVIESDLNTARGTLGSGGVKTRTDLNALNRALFSARSTVQSRVSMPLKTQAIGTGRSSSQAGGRVSMVNKAKKLRDDIQSLREEIVRNVDAGDSLLTLDWTATLQKGINSGLVLELLNPHSLESMLAAVPLRQRYEFQTKLGHEIAKEMKKVTVVDPAERLKEIESTVPDLVDLTSTAVFGSTSEAGIPTELKVGLVSGV